MSYYGSLEGAWVGRLSFSITSPRAFAWPRLAAMSFMRSAEMATTLVQDGERAFVHTTRLTKAGVVLVETRERIAIRDDGRTFALEGEQRTFPSGASSYRAEGEVDATGTRATYRIPWMGLELVQATAIVAEGLAMEQRTPLSRAAVLLRRAEREE